jgi:hypothetical protein
MSGLIQLSDPDWAPEENVLAFTGAIHRPSQNVYELAGISRHATRPL